MANTQVAADHNAPPITRILAKFVATHPVSAAGATPSTTKRTAPS
jgi:hypothetical protein